MKITSYTILYLFAILFLIVHFIPDLGGTDVIAAQWLYMGSMDFLVFCYILFKYNYYKEAINRVFDIPFTHVYSLFLIWALLSYFYAFNPIEALVCLARLVSTYLFFISFSILLYKKDLSIVYKQLSFIVSIVLFFDSFMIILNFFSKVGELDLDSLILSLVGNNGNKNVMAASLLIKIPFALYYILNSKSTGKAIGLLSLFFGVLVILILNTRSTYLGLILTLLIFIISTIFFKRNSAKKSIVVQLTFFIIPVILAFFIANIMLSYALERNDKFGTYGTVTQRIADISYEKRGNRLRLWSAAFDYFKKHPFVGDGYGNWKLSSIPYEKEYTSDLFVPYHAHNDFLETFADLGIVGGVLFAFLFLLVVLFTVKIWKQKKLEQYHFVATISFMAFTCYFIDAFLNFPAERTTMQTMFAFSLALTFAPFHFMTTSINDYTGLKKRIPQIVIALSLAIVLPTVYINSEVYKSHKLQTHVLGELNAEPKIPLSEIKDAFPSIPNLSAYTVPIPSLVARYYMRDKQFHEAMRLLKSSENMNPYLYYNDFLKTMIFASQENFDSALFYSKRAFYNWPKATSYYKNVIFTAARKHDSTEIKKAFATYVKYRNEPEAWNQYLLGSFEVSGATNSVALKMLDSALKLFPKDTITFVKVKELFANGANEISPLVKDLVTKGELAFQKGQYTNAALFYKKASLIDSTNYTHQENIGTCFYMGKRFEIAISYFEKASTFAQAKDGKAEFYKAQCLILLGRKSQACDALNKAKLKHFPKVDPYIAQNCK